VISVDLYGVEYKKEKGGVALGLKKGEEMDR
jgi:hypothetical protein